MTDDPKPPPTPLRLLEFSRKSEGEEAQAPGGIVVPGKQYFPSTHVISSLEAALAKAKQGHLAAAAIVAIATDGSELFFVAANKTTYGDLLGAFRIVESTIVDAALADFTIKPKGGDDRG